MQNIVKSLFVISICGILLTWHFNSDSILPPEEDQELELEIVETYYADDSEIGDEEALVIGLGAALILGPMVVLPIVLYVWANSLAADQPEMGTRNSYTASDAAASTSNASDDLLMQIRWQHAEDDLNWAFVVLKLTVGDMSYDCSTDGWDDCSIGQDGSDNALWEIGEFLTLSENGVDIASGTTTIDLYITYRGTAVAGSDIVTVA
jgi:hypothetical protein